MEYVNKTNGRRPKQYFNMFVVVLIILTVIVIISMYKAYKFGFYSYDINLNESELEKHTDENEFTNPIYTEQEKLDMLANLEKSAEQLTAAEKRAELAKLDSATSTSASSSVSDEGLSRQEKLKILQQLE